MKELIKEEIEKIKSGSISERVKEYTMHPKYAIVRDSVTVTVRLTDGTEAVIDVTDIVLS